MDVYNNAVECARVSSLFVSGSAKFVEIGWFEDPPSAEWNYVCLGTTSGPPRVFAFAYNGGSIDCKTGGELAGGQSHGFTIKDINQDGVWSFGHGGGDFWDSPDMGAFNSGSLEVNGERGGSRSEPADADFNGLDRMDANGNWQSWSNPSEIPESDDPGYKDCIGSGGDRIRVIPQSSSC